MLIKLTKQLISKFWGNSFKMNVCILLYKLLGVKSVFLSWERFNCTIKINWSNIIGWECG